MQMRPILFSVLATCAGALAGCTPAGGAAEPAVELRLETPEAAFLSGQGLLTAGQYAEYCERLLSRQSLAEAERRLMALQQRLRERPMSSEFDPQFAELEAAGLDAAAIRRMNLREFVVALMRKRYAAPPGIGRRPEPKVLAVILGGDIAVVRYRVGPESPIEGRAELVREGAEWKMQEFEPPPPAETVPPPAIPDEPEPIIPGTLDFHICA
jgi:hypothetical protein